jgi:hypothetical protein
VLIGRLVRRLDGDGKEERIGRPWDALTPRREVGILAGFADELRCSRSSYGRAYVDNCLDGFLEAFVQILVC